MTDKVGYCRVIPLSKVVDPCYINLIRDTVLVTNCVIRESYQFVKAYILYCLNNGLECTIINRSFLKIVFSTICDSSKRGRPTGDLRTANILKEFYDEKYMLVQKEKFKAPPKDILDCEIVQMVTGVENHLKTHFYDYIQKLASITISKGGKDRWRIKSKLTSDLYNNTFKSDEKYHDLIREFGPEIIEARKVRNSEPQKSLPLLFKINNRFEQAGIRTFSLLPLRYSEIPASISISKTICKDSFKEEDIWNGIFRNVQDLGFFKGKKFKSGFAFRSIRTNGVSCSLIFVSKESKLEVEEKYIDELNKRQLDSLSKFNIVASDPNKGNLVQLQDENGHLLRYTHIQRKREGDVTRLKKIRRKRENKAKSKDGKQTLNKGIEELSHFNARTGNLEKFLEYVKSKNEFSVNFRSHYQQYYYRKFRFNQFINYKRSKDRFLNNFQDTFGPPSSTVVCAGDWEQRKGMSFGKEPTMGKGMRNWFRSRGYEVYLVDEYNTSRTCSKCKHKNEYNWIYRKDPRHWKNGKSQSIWGLTRCTNSQCGIVHNRDVNSSSNILEISLCHIRRQPIPPQFTRSKQTLDRLSPSISPTLLTLPTLPTSLSAHHTRPKFNFKPSKMVSIAAKMKSLPESDSDDSDSDSNDSD